MHGLLNDTVFGVWLLPGIFLSLVGYILLSQFYHQLDESEQPTTPQGSTFVKPRQDPALQSEFDRIRYEEVPEILEKLPSNNWHRETWYQKGNRWRFTFECNSESRRFFATALGGTPMEAFLITRHRILAQIRDWHLTRFDATPSPQREVTQLEAPRVLIVDDDVDMALAMQTALGQLGCQTEVATGHEGLHRKLALGGVDYIFLDWKLNGQVTAGQVMEKAVRYLDTFSDLRQKFSNHKPQVVTYSVLERDQVALPKGGQPYFYHLDHWQKPLPFDEVVRRASELLTASPLALEA